MMLSDDVKFDFANNYNLEELAFIFIKNIINRAVRDYQSKFVKKTTLDVWKDAKEFIFKGRRLEDLVYKYYMEDRINCRMVRWNARYNRVKYLDNE